MRGEWEPFFKKHGGTFLSNPGTAHFTIEELYQAIKERLKDDLVSDTHGTSHYGLLTDRT
jgi:hypothetical protein